MNIAVTIATYQRKDGRTPSYLNRALKSVFKQTHNDFQVFLVGDHYENEEELAAILNPYDKTKLIWSNLSVSPERVEYANSDRNTKWCCGGLTAINTAVEKAIEYGYDYICHLDHDDFWLEDHLKEINKIIVSKEADWLCTRSAYLNTKILPAVPADKRKLQSFPFLPVPGGIVNSSVCYNHKVIPLRYRNVFKETGVAIPADSDLWERSKKFILEHNLKSYLANITTCFHKEEGYLLHGRQ